MTREEAFNRLEQMYDFYARAMDSDKNHPFEGDAEAIKCALWAMIQDRSAHITREQVKMRGEWKIIEYEFFTCSRCGDSYYSGAESTAQAKSYLNSGHTYDFCPHCGAPMTDEAVDILWKRLEAMQDGAKTG